ncbi:VOC family protein [Psychrosphaera algicola]|uniref:VOC family protein n=1 Tax=Psychrosphaera algicola TaxID=3023714 RepID=A0ABT5FD44_9GAMM|nr:VOC family protein [Psychrosphaera sp. G1-22]MDC2889452.1 VOC family protein [Psychrosphaera sp. G1-22]
MALNIIGIDHIVLRTNNLSGLVSFYSDILNCPIERDRTEELGLIQLRAGHSLIDIIDISGELGREGGGAPCKPVNLDHFCLTVADATIEQISQHIKTHSQSPPRFEVRYGAGGYGPSIYIQDPDGNTVELKAAND